MTRTSAATTSIILRSSMFASPDGFAAPCRIDADGLREFEQRFLQHGQSQLVGDGRAPLVGTDETGLAQHGKMSRQRRLRYRDALGNLACSHRPLPQQLEDPAASGIGKRFEDQVHISLFSEIWKFGNRIRMLFAASI